MHPGLKVYGGDDRIGALTDKVEHNTQFKIGKLNVQCLFTPCHTTGHICYFITAPLEGNDSVVFTGDTLFLGGCGRFFEGTAEQMHKALIEILGNLPDQTKVFCGHEYSLSNLKFAAHVEPDNEEVKKKIQWSESQRGEKKPTVPSTIYEEKLYNPFMRVNQPSVMKHAKKNDAISTMKAIRQEKDNFKG
ncbi:jg13227 [Pararge aegeria aegeria]|uniref:hydroxyacylglutathione hydrolase n=3 Tax=Pararge aegeria TaxID=116150 RepID=A0A8S4RFM1_9NEOP|nr:jg13227 [Pararge aegeria aegeria]